jgi:hypothetical protein
MVNYVSNKISYGVHYVLAVMQCSGLHDNIFCHCRKLHFKLFILLTLGHFSYSAQQISQTLDLAVDSYQTSPEYHEQRKNVFKFFDYRRR